MAGTAGRGRKRTVGLEHHGESAPNISAWGIALSSGAGDTWTVERNVSVP